MPVQNPDLLILHQVAFYVFASLILISAAVVVSRKNPVSSAVALVVTLLSVAGLFLTLKAEFLFAVQVLVYTGGVMVLFLFVIMLVNIDELPFLRSRVRGWTLAFLTMLFVIVGSVWSLRGSEALTASGSLPTPVDGNIKAVAELLFVNYLLPFEVVSILLLVAMVGAIVLSSPEAR
jgi:NADH-quinone oxidoreductase subunit J